MVGSTIGGRYRIHERLAAGGMCDVYKARQVSMDRWVALKVMRVPQSDGGPYAQWFYREMRAAARIQHPNTVRVYDFGQLDEGGFWLAMELLTGRTLEAEIASAKRFPPVRAVHVAMQIAKALNAAHREQVIHRDLKGENILLLDLYGERDYVKVVDFGIASMPGVASSGNMVAGTPEFMSPEQARGLEVDARADLYALGVLLFQMVTGRLPFEHKDPRQVMNMQVHLNPTPPSRYVPGSMPELMEGLILDLLHKDPAERPGSAEEVLDRLAACAAHPEVSRRTHGRWEESSANIVVRPELQIAEADVLEPAGPTLVCTPGQLGLEAPAAPRRSARRMWGWAGAAALGVAALAIPMGLPDGSAPLAVPARAGAVALASLNPPRIVATATPQPGGLHGTEVETAVADRAALAPALIAPADATGDPTGDPTGDLPPLDLLRDVTQPDRPTEGVQPEGEGHGSEWSWAIVDEPVSPWVDEFVTPAPPATASSATASPATASPATASPATASPATASSATAPPAPTSAGAEPLPAQRAPVQEPAPPHPIALKPRAIRSTPVTAPDDPPVLQQSNAEFERWAPRSER